MTVIAKTHPTEEHRSERGVFYLHDENGEIYAAIGAERSRFTGRITEGGQAEMEHVPATRLKHKKTGRESSVLRVEVATRNVLVTGDLDGDGEPSRTKWRSIDEFDVVGSHMSAAALKQRKDRIRAELAELEAQEKKDEKPAQAPKKGA